MFCLHEVNVSVNLSKGTEIEDFEFDLSVNGAPFRISISTI